jgi:hypothetical protein
MRAQTFPPYRHTHFRPKIVRRHGCLHRDVVLGVPSERYSVFLRGEPKENASGKCGGEPRYSAARIASRVREACEPRVCEGRVSAVIGASICICIGAASALHALARAFCIERSGWRYTRGFIASLHAASHHRFVGCWAWCWVLGGMCGAAARHLVGGVVYLK